MEDNGPQAKRSRQQQSAGKEGQGPPSGDYKLRTRTLGFYPDENQPPSLGHEKVGTWLEVGLHFSLL